MKMISDLERIAKLRSELGRSSEGNIGTQTLLSVTCSYLGRERHPTVAGMQALLKGIRKSCNEAIRNIDAALRVGVETLNSERYALSDKAVTMVLQSLRLRFGETFPRQETRDALSNLGKTAEIMEEALGREDT